jgi:hypothetical protein
MQLSPFVGQVRTQLTAAAALGDDATRRTAEALAATADPAIRLAVLAAVTAAADEITAALLDSPGSPGVAVRLDGDDLQVEVRTVEPAEPAPAAEEAEASARISLRLPDALKADIETAARADAVSVNTWLVRAAGRALTAPRHTSPDTHARNAHRITGWING